MAIAGVTAMDGNRRIIKNRNGKSERHWNLGDALGAAAVVALADAGRGPHGPAEATTFEFPGCMKPRTRE